jgi:hypothetical protein
MLPIDKQVRSDYLRRGSKQHQFKFGKTMKHQRGNMGLDGGCSIVASHQSNWGSGGCGTSTQTSVSPKTVGNLALSPEVIRVRHVGQVVLSPSRLRVANHSLIHSRSNRWPHGRLKGINTCLSASSWRLHDGITHDFCTNWTLQKSAQLRHELKG